MKKLNQFDKIAQYYDWLTVFFYGHSIREAQLKYLHHIPKNAHILVLGGGTGWWLKTLLTQNTTCKIWYIEASKKMIHYAMHNTSNFSCIKFIHGTHYDIPKNIQFNVVITFFFLDLFDNNTLAKVINRIKSCTHINSIWLVSDFVNWKKWHSVLLFFMYYCFRLMGLLDTYCLPQWEYEMRNEKLQIVYNTSYFGNFIHSHLYKRLTHDT